MFWIKTDQWNNNRLYFKQAIEEIKRNPKLPECLPKNTRMY